MVMMMMTKMKMVIKMLLYDGDYDDDDDNHHNLPPPPLDHRLGIFCPSHAVAHNIPDSNHNNKERLKKILRKVLSFVKSISITWEQHNRLPPGRRLEQEARFGVSPFKGFLEIKYFNCF